MTNRLILRDHKPLNVALHSFPPFYPPLAVCCLSLLCCSFNIKLALIYQPVSVSNMRTVVHRIKKRTASTPVRFFPFSSVCPPRSPSRLGCGLQGPQGTFVAYSVDTESGIAADCAKSQKIGSPTMCRC